MDNAVTNPAPPPPATAAELRRSSSLPNDGAVAVALEGPNNRSNLLAQASYEQVVSDVGIFMKTLEDLHRSMGTKFMVPTIGGKTLDLHRLFVEVTSRGGFEKAIRDRKWREVIAAFVFPPTITSASFVLRKYYISLLHPYEQVYYFGSGKPKIPNDALPPQAESATSHVNMQQETQHLQPGSLVTGTIKGKFDNGYVITACFGSEVLTGVLYHVPLEPSELQNFSYTSEPCGVKRSRTVMKDPCRPKSHRSGYNFFFAEQCAKLKPLYSREERVIRIADLWNKLGADEKEVYQQKGIKDVERYRIEMLEYKKSSTLREPKYQ